MRMHRRHQPFSFILNLPQNCDSEWARLVWAIGFFMPLFWPLTTAEFSTSYVLKAKVLQNSAVDEG